MRRHTDRCRFWVRRYAPAEVACLATMLAASVVAARLTTSPPLLAASAIAGATVGFYGVLVVKVAGEQRRLVAPGQPRYAMRVASRTVLLLSAEFGAAELLDTFLWRPALMVSAVVLLDEPVWGLLAGKAAADVLFYLVSALGYRLTELAGIRVPRSSAPQRCERRISYVRYGGRHDGHRHLPRADRLADPRRAPTQGADPVPARRGRSGTSQSAVARIEQGNQNLSLEMLGPDRRGAGLARSSRSATPARTHLRVVGGQQAARRHRRQDVQERRRRPAVRLPAQPRAAPRCATSPGSRRSTGSSRCSHSIGVRTRWITERQRPGDRPAGRSWTWPASTSRPPAGPAASSCSSARCCTATDAFRAALRRRLRPRHPHRRAAHDRAAPLRPGGRRRPTATTRRRRPEPPADPPDRADRARRHRHRERAAGRGPPRRHDGDPQRQLQLHGPGPVLLPRASSACGSRASAPRR